MSRRDVLALLRQREGDYVSGQEISDRLGLSRTAIWKAVDALRREGYTCLLYTSDAADEL